MRWEVLIEILLHITPDINTDTGGQAAQFGIPSQHQENTQSGVRPCLVMNECLVIWDQNDFQSIHSLIE